MRHFAGISMLFLQNRLLSQSDYLAQSAKAGQVDGVAAESNGPARLLIGRSGFAQL
jgi:hypothetical protein